MLDTLTTQQDFIHQHFYIFSSTFIQRNDVTNADQHTTAAQGNGAVQTARLETTGSPNSGTQAQRPS